jgi:hypothetical protein
MAAQMGRLSVSLRPITSCDLDEYGSKIFSVSLLKFIYLMLPGGALVSVSLVQSAEVGVLIYVALPYNNGFCVST